MGPAGVEEFIFSVEGETDQLTQTLNAKQQALEVRRLYLIFQWFQTII
jgi:hypothetical protein